LKPASVVTTLSAPMTVMARLVAFCTAFTAVLAEASTASASAGVSKMALIPAVMASLLSVDSSVMNARRP